jgi:hypothetical protein
MSQTDLEDFAMQPLMRVTSSANMFWGSKNTMLERPKVAARVAQCISEWAEIETMMGIFLAVLLHTEAKTALAMYSSLENRSAQRRMILAAAENKLHPDNFDLLQAIFRASIAPVMKERDRLAHWCWGICEELPDDLLIQSPQEKTEMHYLTVHGATPKQASNPDMVFVITEKHLTKLADRTREANAHLTGFICSIWDHFSESERAQFRQKVSSEPRIREALERLSADRQKNLATHAPTPRKAPSEKP